MSIGMIVAGLVILSILSSSLKILQEYERGIVFRLGRSVGVRGPGLIILIPFLLQFLAIQTYSSNITFLGLHVQFLYNKKPSEDSLGFSILLIKLLIVFKFCFRTKYEVSWTNFT